MDFNRVLQLQPCVQYYPWGKFGNDSLVATLLAESDSSKPYAELWIGAHPKAPSLVKIAEKEYTLDQLIRDYPAKILGDKILSRFGTELPFLAKILSIRTALSIQAHPNRQLASKLHGLNPENYPDPKHKPEVAIALNKVSFLYGFRPLEHLSNYLQVIPEFKSLLGDKKFFDLVAEASLKKPGFTRDLYQAVMTAEEQVVHEASLSLYARLSNKIDLSLEEQWILKLAPEYPEGDVGIFSFFILNLCHFEPGEAIFVEANVPHAYLEGDLFECMANSDNVVRAGLTSKFKDVKTLIEMLNYTQGVPRACEVKENLDSEQKAYHCLQFVIPVEEFFIEYFETKDEPIKILNGSQLELVFCLKGRGILSTASESIAFKAGSAFLVPAALTEYRLLLEQGILFKIGVPSC